MTDLRRILKLSGVTTPEILEEAARDRYAQMFKMFDSSGANNALRIWEEAAESEITWARKTLKKEDRIVWYLRYVRISLLQNAIERLSHDERQHPLVEYLNKALTKTVADLAKASGVTTGEVAEMAKTARDNRAFKQNLTHFMSMVGQVAELNAYKFAAQTPSQIVKDLNQIEEDFNDAADDSDKALRPTENSYRHAEKLIDFGDGFAWWNLAVQYCDAEGSAMGHCGNNSHMKKNGDCLLSLRKRTTVGDRITDVPYLTFILDAKNRLGEMKGRGNKKPAQRYHSYITALLLNPIVEGITGGGYLPENNFSLKDLPEEDQEKILEQKPELARGKAATFEDKCEELREAGLDINGDLEGDNVVVWTGGWNDLPQGEVHEALEALRDGVEARVTEVGLSDMIQLLSNLDHDEIAKLAEMGHISLPGDMSRESRYALASDFVSSVAISNFIKHAISGDLTDVSPDDISKFGHLILHRAEVESSENVYPDLEIPDDIFEGTYKLTISMREFNYLYEDIDSDNEDGNELMYFKHSWFRDYSYGESYNDIIDNMHLDNEELKVFNRVNPFIEAYCKDKNNRSGKKIGISLDDVSDDEIADAVKDALSHAPRSYRPGPDMMDDLFGDDPEDFPKHV